MKRIFLLVTISVLCHQKVKAQVIISDKSISNLDLGTKAILKVESNIKGVLLPRLSKVRIEEKKRNYVGETFFSKEDNCLMINVAEDHEQFPEWKCIANKPEVIPKY